MATVTYDHATRFYANTERPAVDSLNLDMHGKSLSFLLLDVNPSDGKKWAWVKSADLIAAMRTKDAAENRGYLLVKEGAAR